MRFIIFAEPKFQAPPDQLSRLIDGSLEWNSRYREHLQEFGLFPGGGGFALVNVPDEATLNEMVVRHPFAFFSDIQAIPFVDGETGWQQLREAAQALGG